MTIYSFLFLHLEIDADKDIPWPIDFEAFWKTHFKL